MFILVRTSHYSSLEKPTIQLATEDYHVYISRSTYHYAYARQTQVNWKKKQRGQKIKERKEKTRKSKNEEGKERKEETKARKDKTRIGSKERKREKTSHTRADPRN